MQAKARGKYREHYALVERVTPPERLLKFRLEEGWEPLCRFLGRPIPDLEFPRVNEGAALKEKIGLIARRGVGNVVMGVLKVVAPVAILALAWWVVGARIA